MPYSRNAVCPRQQSCAGQQPTMGFPSSTPVPGVFDFLMGSSTSPNCVWASHSPSSCLRGIHDQGPLQEATLATSFSAPPTNNRAINVNQQDHIVAFPQCAGFSLKLLLSSWNHTVAPSRSPGRTQPRIHSCGRLRLFSNATLTFLG